MNRTVLAVERLRAGLAVLASVGILSACAGENLFSLAASVGEPGTDVEITTPSPGLTKSVGDSLLVEASVNAPNGAASVVYSGIYEVEQDAAYVEEQRNLNGLTSLSLSNHLQAVPAQRAGTAFVVVTVTDQTGAASADTVTVNITN